MTQHTQPVGAAQHQQLQQQQQQQQQHQQQTSVPQQQQSTTTISNSNNASNNNPTTTSNHTANNNQTTQTVTVQQQHPNNNNNNTSYQQQNATGGQMFNPQLQQANMYVPAHGLPTHHPQHHQQPGGLYHTMIPAAMPSNVYVNNVTANVNLHGWGHTVPHGAWVHPSGANYIHAELPPEQGAPVIQSMPVTLPTPNALTGGVMNPNASVISSATRGSRRGRGRGSMSGSRRTDYNMQRHPQQEGSPVPQQSGQTSQQELQQHQQQGQQQTDGQQMMTTIPASYVQHPQYAAHAQQYQYGYPTLFAPQQHLIHPGQSAAAQQATGTPLYFSQMPVYNGPHMYNYGYYLPPVINQSDYQYGEEVGVGDERQTSADGGALIWHQQPIYTDEYGMSPVDMHAVSSDDMNHNASSIGSANETPTMLSPNYPPLYEQMTQQMGVMQIYDDPQMGQMQVIHRQTGLPQMEEELSECDSQTSVPIQMVPPIQMIPAAVPAPMALQSTTDQILHQQTAHLIPVAGGAIMSIDGSIASNTTPQHQILQHGDNIIDSNLQTYENVSNIQPGESVTSLNEEFVQQNAENVETDYEQQQQQQQVKTQNVIIETEHSHNYSNKKIIMTDVQESQESSSNPAVQAIATTTTDVDVETATSNLSSNNQPQQQLVYHQQQSQEKHYKQPQQYVTKQNVSQQQQQQAYQHQQLQTQPMPQQQQQQTVPTTQSHQQSHYQTSSQHQQHHQQQQHHQTHQQTYDNRKTSQMYNQQHRGRKYEYHHGSSSSNNENSTHQQQQQQQQQQSQQTTKTMSWTNSSQHKKSTNTVGVTAVPTTSHTSGSYNKQQSNNSNTSSSHTHGSRTYTNQQHHNYQQQQSYHYQQQQHQPQTRNYGAMKMPSSPISSAPNTMERKTSQSSDKSQIQQHQSTQAQTTSTASTTVTPHQFQQQQSQQSQQTSTNDVAHPQASLAGSSSSAAAPPTISPKQQSQHNHPGFTTKKHNFSNQGHSVSNATPNVPAPSNAMETQSAPAINLAPPVTNTTPTVPSTKSWASLFSNSSNATSVPISSTTAMANTLPVTTASSSSSTTTTYSKKPIAKVAPYEGLTPITPPPPVVTPGSLSYSAASAQNLPLTASTTAVLTASAAKKASANELQSQRNSLANLDEYSLKFAEFLTKYKNDWATISLRPRGLTNRSNYCYINSILQALIGCSPLYNLIRSIPKQAANLCEVKTPTINAMITFMSNFSNLPTGLRLRNTKGAKGNKDDLGGDLQCDSAFEPTEIYKLWNDSREEHVEGRQEDAEEFLSYILNKLNDEMLEVIKLIAKPNTEQNGPNELAEEDGDVWQMICNNRNKGSVTRQTDFGCTPLSDIFRGELRSRLQREGEHSTDVIQPFFTLQLNIEKAASVKEALEILVGRDQLEGVTGSKTKQEVVAWQQMNLEKLPPILILHLKWFDYRSDGCTKILKKVEFPVELKIDAKILASKKYSQKQRAYRLFAVVYHDGKEATKGHYITDVYHTGYGSWLRYDDSSVKPVSESHVLLPRTPRVPYLLCYRRCDTIPQQSNNNQNSSSTGNNNTSGNTQSSSAK